MENLEVGDVVIVSINNDNESYDFFREEELEITDIHSDELDDLGDLYSLKCVSNNMEIPFSLYGYELDLH